MTLKSRKILLGEYAQPRRRQLSDETTKTIYNGPEPDTYVLYFKDNLILGGKEDAVNGKGILNNRISELLMSRLNDLGIDTHYIRTLNMREQLVRTTEALPYMLTVHNVTSGQFAKRLGLEEGMSLSKPIPEFSLRSKELDNPIVASEHLSALGWGNYEEIEDILLSAQRINDFLSGQFLALNIRLVSFSLQFGRYYTSDLSDSEILITDELSPDTMNLLDLSNEKRLDKQSLKVHSSNSSILYQEVARRLGVLNSENKESTTSNSESKSAGKKTAKKRSTKTKRNPHGHNSH